MYDQAERATLEFTLERSGNGQVMEMETSPETVEITEEYTIYRTPVTVVAGTGRRTQGFVQVVTDEDGVYSVRFRRN